MIQDLPVLLVVAPLLAAPVCVLLRRPRLTALWATLLAWFCLGAALTLLDQVRAHGVISYAIGGWAAPLGIEYRVTITNAYLAVIVTAIAAVVFPFGAGSVGGTVTADRRYLVHALLLLCMAGLLGITVTGDAFNVFVFLEIMSLSSYTLIAMGKGRRAHTAAFSYLILGAIGGTFILLGIGLLYQMTGTLNMQDLAARLPAVMETRTVLVAFAFFFVGTSIKLAVFPLHQWLPNAYTYAPSVVSAFLAATATKVSYYLLVRIVFTIFGAAFVFGRLKLTVILLPLSVIAMFVGSLAAIYQKDIKRLLAYSSVAQVGYMTLGLSFNSLDGLTGGLVHLFNHALLKGGLFLVVACVVSRTDSARIEDMAGIGRRMPLTMAAFVVGGLSLIGVPGTVGFVSKWYLVLGALGHDSFLVAFLILLSSLLAVVYIWRIVEIAWFKPSPVGAPHGDPGLDKLIPTWLLIGATVWFGLQTDLTAGVAREAAAEMLGLLP